jgi:hypothetical protein
VAIVLEVAKHDATAFVVAVIVIVVVVIIINEGCKATVGISGHLTVAHGR